MYTFTLAKVFFLCKLASRHLGTPMILNAPRSLTTVFGAVARACTLYVYSELRFGYTPVCSRVFAYVHQSNLYRVAGRERQLIEFLMTDHCAHCLCVTISECSIFSCKIGFAFYCRAVFRFVCATATTIEQ